MSVYGSFNFSPATYARRKCAKCGKLFECPTKTAYRIEIKNKTAYYCSYSCFREDDIIRRQRDKAEYESHIAAFERMIMSAQKRDLKGAREREQKMIERIAHCAERAEFNWHAYNAAKRGSKTKKKAYKKYREWTRKYESAKTELELIRREIERLEGIA